VMDVKPAIDPPARRATRGPVALHMHCPELRPAFSAVPVLPRPTRMAQDRLRSAQEAGCGLTRQRNSCSA
jgi:hypothetical protein